jgi:hypothetical protein
MAVALTLVGASGAPPRTSTGVQRSVIELSPTSPEPFVPQHLPTPLDNRAQLCVFPALRPATPLASPTTSTGVSLCSVEPSPS